MWLSRMHNCPRMPLIPPKEAQSQEETQSLHPHTSQLPNLVYINSHPAEQTECHRTLRGWGRVGENIQAEFYSRIILTQNRITMLS